MKKLKKPVKKFLAPLVKAYAAGGESNSNPCTITQNGCPCTPGKQRCCNLIFIKASAILSFY